MERELKNYNYITAPFQDASTKAVFMEAVYTLGKYEIDIEEKYIYFNIKVWAGVDAFEQGGKSLGVAKEYLLTNSSGLNFDDVMERFPELKQQTAETLLTISTELDAGVHNKVETVAELAEVL